MLQSSETWRLWPFMNDLYQQMVGWASLQYWPLQWMRSSPEYRSPQYVNDHLDHLTSDQTNVWMIFAQFWSHQHVDDFLNLPHEEWIHRSNKHGGEFNPEFSIADKLAKTIRFCFDRNKWYFSIYYYSNWCQRHPWVYHQCVTACMH